MPVVRVNTQEEAQTLRNGYGIGVGNGVLILNADLGGEPKHLLEKIIRGEKYVGKAFADTPWKRGDKGPLVIVVGASSEPLLQAVDALVPGFSELI